MARPLRMKMQSKAVVHGDALSIPKVQRWRSPPSLQTISRGHRRRNDAIIVAYATGAYSDREIAEYRGLHLATIGRIIRKSLLQGEN